MVAATKEHAVGHLPGFGGEGAETDAGEDEDVVRLSDDVGAPV